MCGSCSNQGSYEGGVGSVPRSRGGFWPISGSPRDGFGFFDPQSLDAGIYCCVRSGALRERRLWRHIAVTKPLFAWESLEDSPRLGTIQQRRASLPDAQLLAGLRQHRDRGRNDYPVHVLWGVVRRRIILRHVSFEATLGERQRNAGLRGRLGIASEQDVPKAWNLCRFLEVLGQEPHGTHLRDVFATMGRRLAEAVPDLGQNTAGDSTALHTRPKSNAKAVRAEGAGATDGGPQGIHG